MLASGDSWPFGAFAPLALALGIDAVLAICDGQSTMVLTSRAAMVSAACNEEGSTFADQVAKCGPGESTCGPPSGIVLRSGHKASRDCACDEASPMTNCDVR